MWQLTDSLTRLHYIYPIIWPLSHSHVSITPTLLCGNSFTHSHVSITLILPCDLSLTLLKYTYPNIWPLYHSDVFNTPTLPCDHSLTDSTMSPLHLPYHMTTLLLRCRDDTYPSEWYNSLTHTSQVSTTPTLSTRWSLVLLQFLTCRIPKASWYMLNDQTKIRPKVSYDCELLVFLDAK